MLDGKVREERQQRQMQDNVFGAESQRTESQGMERLGTESLGTESQGTESLGIESQRTESQRTESQRTESQGMERLGTESLGTESQGTESHLDEKAMLREQFSRTGMLLGETALEILEKSRVAVFGIGGVGGYVVEALARSGVACFDLIDNDKVCLSNLNRQIIATRETVGQYKVDVMRDRILSINPRVDVRARKCFYLPETAGEFEFGEYSYVVDAVDTVTAKIDIILRAQEAGVPVISSMGAGNKLDPTKFQVADIYETSVCPLAKVMRRELRKRGVERLKVVYSTEEPVKPAGLGPGSIAFVPSVAGLIIAGEVVRDLVKFGD